MSGSVVIREVAGIVKSFVWVAVLAYVAGLSTCGYYHDQTKPRPTIDVEQYNVRPGYVPEEGNQQ